MAWKAGWVFLFLVALAVPVAGGEPASPLPFDLHAEPDDPAAPQALDALATQDGWLVSWDAVVAQGASLSYEVHVWQASEGWVTRSTTGTELAVGATEAGGLITVTSLAVTPEGRSEESPAQEFLLVLSDRATTCPFAKVWSSPPPPGAAIDVECVL